VLRRTEYSMRYRLFHLTAEEVANSFIHGKTTEFLNISRSGARHPIPCSAGVIGLDGVYEQPGKY
jgi:hypothetical protein